MLQGSQPPRIDREALGDGDSGAFVTRIGTIVGGGLWAAIAASVPASIRVGRGGSGARALETWLVLAALALPFGILAVGLLRRARVGLRVLVGERATVLAACAAWWAVLEAGVLSVLGAILRAKTHHHGLAGVTFAMAALASGAAAALVAARVGASLARAPEATQRRVLYVAASVAFVTVALIGVRTARAEGLSTGPALVDVLALVVASAIASTRPFSLSRGLAMIGVPIAAVALVLGVATLRADPALRDAVAAVAPVHGWLLALFSR